MSRLPLRFTNWLRRYRGAAIATAALAAAAFTPNAALAVVTLSGGGLVLAEQGGTFAPNNVAGASFGATPFASSELAGFGHTTVKLNNESYGNASSWIGGDPPIAFPAPFAGISLDGSFTLQSIAFGRSNVTTGDPCAGGVCTDRALGLYTLQYTTALNPSASTPDASWTTIGTLNYVSAGGHNFTAPHLRHRYNFDPIADVTGVRLLVPTTGLGGGTAIDEIELYEAAGIVVPPPPAFTITPAAGHGIAWDGNDGAHFDPAPPPAGAVVPENLARASSGAIAFSSSDLGPEIAPDFPFHRALNLNDGTYGNSNSWIPGNANPAGIFGGVALDGLFNVTQVAWGRDNGNGAFDDSVPGTDCCGGQADDRSLGLYTLQYTQVPNADATTPHTGDPTTGWADVGSLNYLTSDDAAPGGGFTSYLRHAFDVSADGAPLVASGIRLIVPGGTAIDELEVYGSAVPEPSTYAMVAMAIGSVTMLRRRRK